jgi:hypothetical protein
MDDANLMVIVHNSNDKRDKAPKHVRRKRKAAYKPYLGDAVSTVHDFDDSKMGRRRPPVSPKEEKPQQPKTLVKEEQVYEKTSRQISSS